MNFKTNESRQKLRGAYYTPAHIARFLAQWVLEIKPNRILEPSCGDGEFFAALASQSASKDTRLVGHELEPEEASKALGRAESLGFSNASVCVGDFIEQADAAIAAGIRYDAVIGNPPFVRYQYIDKHIQHRMERLFARIGISFTKHTNLWVPFVLAGIELLAEGGRLAFVIPAEILHVLHAAPLRDHLAECCDEVVIVDPADIWFGDTLQGVVLLMVQKKRRKSRHPAKLEIIALKSRDELDTPLRELSKEKNKTSTAGLGAKWVSALLTPSEREALSDLCHEPAVREFHDIATAEVGIVTGANKFFFVNDAVVSQYQLERWAKPMMGRSDHIDGIIYDAQQHERNRQRGIPTNFLDFEVPFLKRTPAVVRSYIELGEEEGLHRRYKCRIRQPWYVVPSVYNTSVGLLKRSHYMPRLFLNEIGAYTTDTAYRVKPINVKPESLVGSFINSLTALTAELEGRHYGGGVLEVVPSEIERLRVPLAGFGKGELRELDRLVANGTGALDLLERQDKILCKKLGLDMATFSVLRSAYDRLRARRMRVPLPTAEDE